MLSLSCVQASYGSSQVLFDVNLDVRDGEVVTLLGRSRTTQDKTAKTYVF